MTQRTTVFALIATTTVLSACSVNTPEAEVIRVSSDAPRLLVELPSLPDGHPPVPGYSSLPTLPEGHPPVPGYQSAPTLPAGHPRCPARGAIETPPSDDAGLEHAPSTPPALIST